MTRRLLVAIVLLSACGRRAAAPVHAALSVSITRSGGALVVRAIPAPGTRINALLPPLLEFPSGRTDRLVSSSLSADSAYFEAPPEVSLPGDTPLAGALIRASVCDSGAAVCRVVVVPL